MAGVYQKTFNEQKGLSRENYPMQDEHETGEAAGAVSNAR
jgi:hypothetical protein